MQAHSFVEPRTSKRRRAMLSSGVDDYIWNASFSSIALSYLARYPSPLAKHVIHQDTLHRYYDSETQMLHVYRLLRKSGGKLPKWAPKLPIAESWVLEHTEVNALQGVIKSTTKNIDLKQYCRVTDNFRLEELAPQKCLLQVSADADSPYIPPFASLASFAQSRIENFYIKSYKRRIERTRASLQLTHTLIHHPRSTYRDSVLLPDRSHPLPHDLLKDHLFAEGFQHWEMVGSGFSGHGVVVVNEEEDAPFHTQAPPAAAPLSRPDYLDPLKYSWWLSMWNRDRDGGQPFQPVARLRERFWSFYARATRLFWTPPRQVKDEQQLPASTREEVER